MAISRSLMNRQLYANGGIMQVAPREKFGLGSKLKKFVRKIIPNEVAEIATQAAPFVAPFNPALAAGMAGIGSFDQTGSIGDSLKRGALTYGGGQAARYIGGAGFQGNPFASGGAFTPSGFTSGFSKPIGTDTGLGKFFSNRGTEGVQGISVDSGRAGDSASALSRSTANAPTEIIPTNLNDYAGTEIIPTNLNDYAGTATNALVDASDMSLVGDVKQAASQEFNLFKAAAEKVQNFDYREAGNKALELGKKFGKAIYTDKDGNLDKAALLGTIAFAGSYAEAKALAADAGVEITPEEYDEATKEDKKAEYASYLTNFFGGQKDGGRIGYEGGTNEYITRRKREGGLRDLLGGIDPTIDESDQKIIVVMTENGPQMMTESEFNKQMGIDNETQPVIIDMMSFGNEEKPMIIDLGKDMKKDGGRIGFKDGTDDDAFEELDNIRELVHTLMKEEDISESEAYEKVIKKLYAKGGRVSRKFGSPKEGESEIGIMSIDVEAGNDDEEDMKMAGITFSSAEKSYLFRKLGGAGGSDRSYTMPQLYRVLSNPDRYAEDAAVLKEIAIMGLGKKDGGRIGFAFGSPDRKTDIEEELSVDTIYRPTDKPPMLEEMPGGDKMVGMGNTMKLFETPYGFDRDRFEFMYNEYLDSGKDIPLYDFAIEFLDMVKKDTPKSSITMAAKGGRIGYKGGANRVSELLILRDELIGKGEDVSDIEAEIFQLTGKTFKSVGGISDLPTGKIRKNNAGVVERDYRDEGGFVPVGIKERADDVPAMLSKNEFVMTADAVRGIGNGSVEEGSKKLYNTMKQAEKVGKA
jgi:hypothetical protein